MGCWFWYLKCSFRKRSERAEVLAKTSTSRAKIHVVANLRHSMEPLISRHRSSRHSIHLRPLPTTLQWLRDLYRGHTRATRLVQRSFSTGSTKMHRSVDMESRKTSKRTTKTAREARNHNQRPKRRRNPNQSPRREREAEPKEAGNQGQRKRAHLRILGHPSFCQLMNTQH